MVGKVSIVSIGTAVYDTLLSGEVFKAHVEEDGELVEEFKLGEKYEVQQVDFSTGGGATNGAVTFARQGLTTSAICKVGRDVPGKAVLDDLEKDGVDTSGVVYSDKKTGYSTIIISPRGARVVLVHRGASADFHKKDFNLSKIHADWMFITSLGGNMDVIETLVTHAKAQHMKVALIPGKGELKNKDKLKQIAKSVDVFSANKEEYESLIAGENIESLAVQMAHHMGGGIAVVTDGPNGVVTSDGKRACRAGMYEDVPVIDRLGAGDAFASGFVAAIAKGGSMEDAILLGSANSTSVVTKVGAKTGILKGDEELHDMPIECWDV